MSSSPQGSRTRVRALLALAALLVVAPLAVVAASDRAAFVAGGAMIDLGYRLQNPFQRFDFQHEHDLAPSAILREVLAQNTLSAGVRARFPRETHHPLVAMVVCMDARIDTNELVGDTRKYYYFVRTAGSVLGEREEDMLDLAVSNGVRLVLFTRHSECAAERVAADPAARLRYPNLAAGVDSRDAREQAFLARPSIAARIAAGTLLVRNARVDTRNERLTLAP